MPKPSLEFWFEFASTYSYLSAARIVGLAAKSNVDIVWRPFLLGPIFAEHGLADSPFNIYPVKGRYMWRDMERLCEGYGLEFGRPSVFPRNGLLAARVACASLGEAWLPDFVVAVYTANFARDLPIDEEGTLAALLDEVGADAAAVLRAAGADDAKLRLRSHTEQAATLGVFGAPSFTSGNELFWGNDRLTQAIAHAQNTA